MDLVTHEDIFSSILVANIHFRSETSNKKEDFCMLAGKWRNCREKEKAENLNLLGFSPFIA